MCQLIPINKEGKWGYCNIRKDVLINYTYDEATPFVNGLAVVKNDSKFGVINTNGEYVVTNLFDQIKLVQNFILVTNNPRKFSKRSSGINGLYYKTGELIFPVGELDEFYYKKEKLFVFGINGKYGLINSNGKKIVDCQYDQIEFCLSDELIKVAQINQKRTHSYLAVFGGVDDIVVDWGFTDYNGNMLINCSYHKARDFSENLAAIAYEDYDFQTKWGFVTKSGEYQIPLLYEDALSFSEGLAGVKFNGKWGFIDKNNQVVIPFRYDVVGNFQNGVAKIGVGDYIQMARLNQFVGKYGLIDRSANEIVSPIYEIIESIEPTRMLVSKGVWVEGTGGFEYPLHIFRAKYGYIDQNGIEIIPLIYDFLSAYENGVAVAGIGTDYGHKFKGKFALIDFNGNLLTQFKYDQLKLFQSGFSKFEYGSWDSEMLESYPEYAGFDVRGSGFLTRDGSEKTNLFDQARDFQEGMAAISSEAKWGFIEENNYSSVIKCIYDKVDNFRNGLSLVKIDDKEFYIDKSGIEYLPNF